MEGYMLRRILSLVVIPTALLICSLDARSDQADPEEVAHVKAGHKKVEGVVIEMKSGLYKIRTATGATMTLTESASVRHGHGTPSIGDEMTLWVNEGNMVIDARPKGQPHKGPRFISGTLASIDYGQSQMMLSTSEGEISYRLKPETRMFRDIAAGSKVTIEVNEHGEVIDLHKDKQ